MIRLMMEVTLVVVVFVVVRAVAIWDASGGGWVGSDCGGWGETTKVAVNIVVGLRT